MRFCGIDQHSNNSVVVVTNETDKVLTSRRCPNDLSMLLALLAPHLDELSGVVVESTYNGYWLVDGLMAAGYNVKLQHRCHETLRRIENNKWGQTEPSRIFRIAALIRAWLL
jgi:hypothetical protein